MSRRAAALEEQKELFRLAELVIRTAKAKGAQEVNVSVSSGNQSTISRREGRVEQATRATTRGLGVSLLVDDRYSSHSTSDLRPDALEHFLSQAVDATRFLEPDPDRRLPDSALCGRGPSAEHLDQLDPGYWDRGPEEDGALAQRLEELLKARHRGDTVSSSVYVGTGYAQSLRVMTNGFSDVDEGAWFAYGGDMTLDEGNGKRPESGAYYASRYLSDLPSADLVCQEIADRTAERLGAGPIESGTYPMVLQNRSVGRILGSFLSPLSGSALFENRSCLAGKLGQTLGSPLFTVKDDPTIPRGLGSRPWDGDAFVATPRTIVENGVLKEYALSSYYARRLGMAPTTGSRSNILIPAGTQSVEALCAAYPKAILVSGFLGGNGNDATGDFSVGIRGMLLEHGKPTKPLAEMNVTGNILEIFHRLVALADDPWAYSSVMTPSMIFEGVQFSGA